jgi:hypothetical protein
MALPAPCTPDQLAKMSAEDLWLYFHQNARYIQDAPALRARYAIRFGSQTLSSDDTLELRTKFESAVKNHRRRRSKSHDRSR